MIRQLETVDLRTELCIRDVNMRIIHLKRIISQKATEREREEVVHRAEKSQETISEGINFWRQEEVNKGYG